MKIEIDIFDFRGILKSVLAAQGKKPLQTVAT